MKHLSAPVADWRWLAPAAVLLAGAVLYGVLVGGGSLRFATTPLLLGLIVVAAGLVGTRRRVIGTGLVLAGWGAASDMADLGRWRIWSALLVGWAAWETFWGWRDRRGGAR